MIVKGAAQFIDFLKQAFDAHEFGHAEVWVGDSTLMIADGRKEWRDTPCFLSIYVDDADDVFEQALHAGATPVTDMTTFNILGDRTGRVRDPFGNIWWIQAHIRDVSPEEMAALVQDPKEMAVMQKMQDTFVQEMNKHFL